MFESLDKLRQAKTSRFSSWDRTGKNADFWVVPAGESKVLADIQGPGKITHIWMTQDKHYRECLLKITFDNAAAPSVLVPLGDFFGLGNCIVNSYQSLLFTASTPANNRFNTGCALNCYAPMPFRERAVVELVNESGEEHLQYFYIDYERYDVAPGDDLGYFHAEFRRENPFGGWGHEIEVNTPEADIPNKERLAWDNNYVILETQGRGHYIGCNLSVTNLQGTWWGEGDDMIWVDGYKWPPDLHGTGSEDYLNQAWGNQPNAYLRNGSSIFEGYNNPGKWPCADCGGYQTSYVHHLENPVHFTKEIKVTIEHGHGNHLRNEMASVAYWYADRPYAAKAVPPVEKRRPILRDQDGSWLIDPKAQTTSREVPLNADMKAHKTRWAEKHRVASASIALDPRPLTGWEWCGPFAGKSNADGTPDLGVVFSPELGLPEHGRTPAPAGLWQPGADRDGLVDFGQLLGKLGTDVGYARVTFKHAGAARKTLCLRVDYFARVWVNGREVALQRTSDTMNSRAPLPFAAELRDGENEILVKVHPGTQGHAMMVNFAR
jgi:hypothetical protein